MVLIPKQKRKEEVDNPFRPKIGVTRKHTACKIGWASYHVEHDQIERRLRVDADHDDNFVTSLETEIPRHDRYRCSDREVWFIDKKWKKFIVELAKKSFDKVEMELRGFS